MTDPVPRLPSLLEAVLSVGTDLDLRATLQRIVDGAAELTGARYAALGMTDPGHDGLVEIRAARPYAPGTEKGPAVPTGDRLEVPLCIGDEVFGDLWLAGKPDGPFTEEDEQLLRILATQAGIAIANARLYETARQRERWIEGAAAVTTALLTADEASDALAIVAERARVLAGATAGVILQPNRAGGMEIVTASMLGDPGNIVGATIAPGSPVLDQLLSGEPVFIDDSATDPRMTTHVRTRFGPSMMLPLQAEGRLIGTLALPRTRGGRPYTPVERLLATQFASQAALAVVLADARHRRERLAVYEDRDRIARDLHDLVVQRLFATGMMLESTRRRSVAAGGEDVSEMLGRAVDELQATVQEVRTAIFALQQPPADAPTTFRGKVLREAAGAAAVVGFQPSARFTGPVESRLTEPVAGQLLAALRRALAAATRRAGVSWIEVTVDVTATLPDGRPGVRLTVRDDGAADGVPPGADRGARTGTDHGIPTGADRASGEGRGGGEEGGGEAATGGRGAGGDGAGTTVTWQSPL
ncbi:GAF domain-containing protein [Streptomyces sp. 142MFCol3.1]|uniref:GAF domain-containing protein n=1 Tax=Streptomyces sp. 142MFCol3.1 TaxID=1172179 RepID=UPI000403390D|nr:GAF domain-containing protein [Streptomyces sp. 142MFCol3.1]